MKKLAFFFSLLLVTVTFLFVSCGGDDEPTPDPETVSFDVVFSSGTVDAEASGIRPVISKQMSDVLSKNKDKAKSVKAASIQNGQSYITLRGEGFRTPQKVTINLLESAEATSRVLYTYDLNFTATDANGINDSTNPCLSFLNNVVTNLASKKAINLQVIFKAGNQSFSNLTLTVHSTATYSW